MSYNERLFHCEIGNAGPPEALGVLPGRSRAGRHLPGAEEEPGDEGAIGKPRRGLGEGMNATQRTAESQFGRDRHQHEHSVHGPEPVCGSHAAGMGKSFGRATTRRKAVGLTLLSRTITTHARIC